MEEEQKLQEYIQILDKKVYKQDFQNNYQYILPHEHLFQIIPTENKEFLYSTLTIQNIKTISKNPDNCLENLNISDTILQDNELKQFSKNIKLDENKKMLIIESTNNINGQSLQKLQQLQQSNQNLIDIVFGYTYVVDKNSLYQNEEKNLIMHSVENIIQSIKYQFQYGTENGLKPSFIGEICLNQIDLNDNVLQNMVCGYLQVSNQYNTPVYFNLQYNYQNYDKISQLLKQCGQQNYNNKVYILWNPYINFQFEKSANYNGEVQITKISTQLKEIKNLLDKGYKIGIDTVRYSDQQQELGYFLKQLLLINQDYCKQILISTGINYKSDLTLYGGNGISDCFYFKNILQELQVNEIQLKDMFYTNFQELFFWAKEKIKVEKVEMFKCNICKKEFEEGKIDKFKKFGKEFCSMKCLKAFLK
ncbi:hypothetical protein PPERSA_07465 [Pseudocohnilembus persalinus]|uniref:Phosphotriesterase-related protein n=1 Tax=Pseudocohnilembus persalinus TaxID=266149 RepID=A0A0V0QAG7_PSEPJ|nr:hypothetical protein PPERSA_07465 [Pseudocohnilembus persalinus]|eukprot:KRW99222.1 hypothetical protein PPERSA_07465 [Pseudocohnilembus persalinus]